MVQTGDTLYSIAFRAGLDYRELAQLNNISPPSHFRWSNFTY
jgi:lipoprotein NlpD